MHNQKDDHDDDDNGWTFWQFGAWYHGHQQKEKQWPLFECEYVQGKWMKMRNEKTSVVCNR